MDLYEWKELIMSRVCKITGKRPRVANNVSKANNKTKRRQFPNLQSKKYFIPELGKTVRLSLSVKAIKTIDRYGLLPYLKKKGLSVTDIA
jgi:large subunit ribosomal protein L28|tara:strand:+ start:339 stop:608 length:270 start_codon:yes stop_codon:yes gene_type:complete